MSAVFMVVLFEPTAGRLIVSVRLSSFRVEAKYPKVSASTLVMLPACVGSTNPVLSMKRRPPFCTSTEPTLRFGPSHTALGFVNALPAGEPFVPVGAHTVYWQPVGPCTPPLGIRFSRLML